VRISPTKIWLLVVGLGLTLFESTPILAQWMGKQTGCYADHIAANPNRPTVADPADITQYGVLEIEYGWDQTWPMPDTNQTSLGGLLKFAVLCDVELRWTTTSFLSVTNSDGTAQGFGDNWLGSQVRIYKQTRRVPTLAFGYAAKIPSASEPKGLGTGKVDHSITFLASKDVDGIHFDFNISHFLLGRDNRGHDHAEQGNLAFSHFLKKKLEFTGELYGETYANPSNPEFVSSLWALTYGVSPRLVIDGGFEIGITSGGPHRHAFVGFTYSIVNVYQHLR